MELKDYLEQKRTENNLSQENIAEKLGVTSRTVKRWETGKTYPDPTIWEKLCNVYKLDKNEFVRLYSQNFLTLPKIEVNNKPIEKVEVKKSEYPELLIKPFKLTKEEQDLIRLIEIFKDDKEYIEGDKKTIVKSLNPLSNIPLEYLKDPLETQELYVDLKQRLGVYYDKVVSIIMSNPSELFDVEKLTKADVIRLSSVTVRGLDTFYPLLSHFSDGSCKISTPINEETGEFNLLYPELRNLFNSLKLEPFKCTRFISFKAENDKDYSYLVEKYKLDAQEYANNPLELDPPTKPVNHRYIYARLTQEGKELYKWYKE